MQRDLLETKMEREGEKKSDEIMDEQMT